MAAVTQTITRTIVGINPIGNNIWQIEFDPAQTQITSDVSTNPVIYYSSSLLPVILNPFLFIFCSLVHMKKKGRTLFYFIYKFIYKTPLY